jgi:hypothetical protein
LRDFFNLFHSGVTMTFLEVIGKTETVDSSWKVYADTNGIPLGKGGRGEDALAKKLDSFLQQHFKEVFPNRDLFESSRSLWNTMKRLRCWEDFGRIVGGSCDFCAPGLVHRDAIKLIHFWSTQVTKFVTSQHFTVPELKTVFLQGVKTMIPMDPATASSSSFSTNWIIQKWSPDAEGLMKLVLTGMSDSKTYQPARDKRDGKEPIEEPPTKKQKSNSSGEKNKFSQDLSSLNLEVTIGGKDKSGNKKSRGVYWLDDVQVMIKGALQDADLLSAGSDRSDIKSAEALAQTQERSQSQ